MGPGSVWDQGMGMFPAGPSGNFGGQAQGANSSMQVCHMLVCTSLESQPVSATVRCMFGNTADM